MMLYTKVAWAFGIGLCIVALMAAQDNPKANAATSTIAPVAAGQETFRVYCAACHGQDAKGTGPVAQVLRYRPSDLTVLSKRNGGKFPPAVIEQALQDNHLILAHGSRDTPIWGDAFRNQDQNVVKLKIHNLVLYIESLQEK